MFKKIRCFILEMNCVSDYYTFKHVEFSVLLKLITENFSPTFYFEKNFQQRSWKRNILNTCILLHRFTSNCLFAIFFSLSLSSSLPPSLYLSHFFFLPKPFKVSFKHQDISPLNILAGSRSVVLWEYPKVWICLSVSSWFHLG